MSEDKEKQQGEVPIPVFDQDYVEPPWGKDVVEAVDHRDRVLLRGPTGIGKTSFIEWLAASREQPCIRANLNGETTATEFIGQFLAVSQETKWTDGVLPMCLRKGWWLIADELDFAEPAILAALHSVLEDDGKLVLMDCQGEVVRPHEGFRVFGTANSIGGTYEDRALYQGTNQMNAAFFKPLECDVQD